MEEEMDIRFELNLLSIPHIHFEADIPKKTYGS